MSDLHDEDSLARTERAIDGWLAAFAAASPAVRAVDRDTETSRWFVRLAGEAKDFTTVWLTLGQRTVRYETYVMPAPEENEQQVADLLLRRNNVLVGCHFSVGDEDAIYLRGELPDVAVDEDELDRVLGTLYATVEANFRPLLRLAFASRFAG